MHLIISFFLLSAQPNLSDVFIQELFQNTYGFNVLLIMNIWRGLVILAVGLVSFGFCPLFGSQGIFGHQSHKDWHLQSKCLEDHTFLVIKMAHFHSLLSVQFFPLRLYILGCGKKIVVFLLFAFNSGEFKFKSKSTKDNWKFTFLNCP